MNHNTHPMQQPTADDSELRLQAILYLLDDPALDADEFEARLAVDDGRLATLLAEAVTDLEALRAAEHIDAARLCAVSVSANAVTPRIRDRGPSSWAWMAALAVGIALVAFVGLQSRPASTSSSTELSASTARNDSARFLNAESDSDDSLAPTVAHSLVRTWAQFQADGPAFDADGYESELAWSESSDEIIERDVPDWLVLAASVVEPNVVESDVN